MPELSSPVISMVPLPGRAEHPPSVGGRGLSADEAQRRRLQEGGNVLPSAVGGGLWRIAWAVFCEPMFLLLLAAGGLYLLIGGLADALLLLGFVGLVMGITIVQERRTERALEALRDLSSPQATAIRDGRRVRLPAADLVRGDLIVVAEGERVPADGLLRRGDGIATDESLLTGEAVPVHKIPSADASAMDPPGGDGHPSLFSGTLVTTGQGEVEILATGPLTEVGRIGTALARLVPERTRLQQETGRLVRGLAVIGLSLCVVVVVVYALTRGGDAASWNQGLLAGIAMAMAVIPEEFPVILTIFLALGAWRIAHQRVLTRRLPAFEMLGAATVLCTDKTGTLTCNRMTVVRVVVDGRESIVPAAALSAEVGSLLTCAVGASRAEPFDPMERAIHAAVPAGTATPSAGRWTLVREYPLTPALLAVIQVWAVPGEPQLVIAAKGAPETILGLCHLATTEREATLARVAALAGDGLRVLGVARGQIAGGNLPADPRELPLTFLGLLGLADPLRADVPAAVAECRSAGIRVVMITGDHAATAGAIARQAGIDDGSAIVTGSELAAMPEAELRLRVRGIRVFARIAPEQKLRIVEALKAVREVVAMTGDGVNDAPALKAAHIGIAMGGRGTDVARESAALVLLDDDFAAIVAAIRMGRRIFANITKAVAFTIAVHVPIAGLSMLAVFMPGWPLLLLPAHIAFLELVINPACTLVFEGEPAEADMMRRAPRDPAVRLFRGRLLGLGLLQGGGVLIVCAVLFAYARRAGSDEEARGLVFVALVLSALALILVNRSDERSLWRTLVTPNRAYWWVLTGAVALLIIVTAVPAVRGLFHIAPLTLRDVSLGVLAGVLCLGWCEMLKIIARHGRFAPAKRPPVPVPV